MFPERKRRYFKRIVEQLLRNKSELEELKKSNVESIEFTNKIRSARKSIDAQFEARVVEIERANTSETFTVQKSARSRESSKQVSFNIEPNNILRNEKFTKTSEMLPVVEFESHPETKR